MEDDHAADLFLETNRIMAQAGMPAYEISNHAGRARNAATI